MLAIIYGDEPYRTETMVKKTRANYDEMEQRVTTVFNESDEVWCMQYPVFSEKKLIVFSPDKQESITDEFLDMCEDIPDFVDMLVVCNYNLDTRRKIYKRMEKNASVKKLSKYTDNELQAQISSYMQKQDKRIQPEAMTLLMDYLQYNEQPEMNFHGVMNELDKLIISTPEDLVGVENITRILQPVELCNIFDLIGYVEKGQRDKFFKAIEILKKDNSFNAIGLFNLLQRGYRLAYKVKRYGRDTKKLGTGFIPKISTNNPEKYIHLLEEGIVAIKSGKYNSNEALVLYGSRLFFVDCEI